MLTRNSTTVYTDLDTHADVVAAPESAARLLTTEYAPLVRDMIEQSLTDDEGYEYAVSLARPAPDEAFITGGPTRGVQPGEVGVHAPNEVMGEDIPDEFRGDVSYESTHRHSYADLIMTHTHDTYDVPEVGLSYGDLSDKIPGPDDLTGKSLPCDLYRAQSAVVFTNDPARLPVDTAQERFPVDDTTEPWTDAAYVFGDRPEVRPWLHLVERTPAACALDRGAVSDLHHRSLEHPGATHAEKFRHARDTLGELVAELIVPLSP